MTSSEMPNEYQRATGPFEITMSQQPPYDTADGVSLGRVTINKRFHGQLEANSVVEMLSAMTNISSATRVKD